MSIQFQSIDYRYPGSPNGVSGVDLTIADGEFLAVIGPSGSGKTTLLKLLAGFARPSSGRIIVDDRDITDLPPEKRQLGVVFQSYGLFPHMSALDNVAYPLKIRRVARAERRARAAEALERVGLTQWTHSMPTALSGGQQQRVALARALVFSPSALLLDEPLSALDAALRVEMREEILRVQRAANIATLHITHDQEEALSIADRIAIMQAGRIVQLGTPKDLYDRPVNRWVASFIGQANLWEGRVGADRRSVHTPIGVLACDDAGSHAAHAPVTVLIRPEAIQPGGTAPAGVNALGGTVHADRFLGSARRIDLAIGEGLVRIDTLSRAPFDTVVVPPESIRLLPPEHPSDSSPAP
ncbi:ABC transporter ATP-binding protein [Castellaniella hirudinis]|uniref:ABC transporter ATP-binding protein n=1 Tax=Castellaniella hirudinis TaxID=1144617 RepID=A0ABV8RV60_9BURK